MMPATSVSTSLKPEFPRRYVAPDARFDAWAAAEPYYRRLLECPIRSAAELEKWLMDWSELDACFEEEGAVRYVAMTCQTDDPQREKAHLDFIGDIKPRREPWLLKLRRKLVESAAAFPLPPKRFEVLLRSARNAIELFREENIPLQTEDERLRQQYQKITAAMTIEYDGREQTLQQMARYLEEPDRAVRETAWHLTADRFLQDKDVLNTLYEKMVALRHRMARNAGCADFREYAFKRMERFDYTPQDCLRYHDAIERIVVPAATQIAEQRRARLGLATLRPWDFDVDPDNRPPLRPFDGERRLSDGCGRIFQRIHPDFANVFGLLVSRGLLDLGSRKGKAPGGYQETYQERRTPFIFMNAVGTEGDVDTLLHEGGHAFHTWACRNEPLLPYRNYPLEFAEVASMGMELLARPHLDEFYGPDAGRARKRHLEDIIYFLPWMARVDALQHYVYTHAEGDPSRWLDEWQSLTRRFAPYQDWSGLEGCDRYSWHRKLHFFEAPFYYIEYGIAQLGALQVWVNSRHDYDQAVAMYRAGLTLGGARPLPELFSAAGCKFDFSDQGLRPLIDSVMDETGRL